MPERQVRQLRASQIAGLLVLTIVVSGLAVIVTWGVFFRPRMEVAGEDAAANAVAAPVAGAAPSDLNGAAPGQLSVITDPPGARVAIDRKPMGATPVTLGNLSAGDHTVTVTTEGQQLERRIRIAAGGTASATFIMPKEVGPVGGWLSINAPFDVVVSERDEVIGTNGAPRIMIPSGRHELVLSNRTLGFSDTRSIEVTAGTTTTIRVQPPSAPVSVNARPWAEVFVDGRSLGQTPIANTRLTIGTHALVFRHPKLGERAQTAVVTTNGPNRFTVDFTR